MAIKTYLLYCHRCGNKRISDGTDVCDLIEIKTTSIQTSIPKIENGKFIEASYKKQKKKFKCPKCGSCFVVKKIKEPAPKEDPDD